MGRLSSHCPFLRSRKLSLTFQAPSARSDALGRAETSGGKSEDVEKKWSGIRFLITARSSPRGNVSKVRLALLVFKAPRP